MVKAEVGSPDLDLAGDSITAVYKASSSEANCTALGVCSLAMVTTSSWVVGCLFGTINFIIYIITALRGFNQDKNNGSIKIRHGAWHKKRSTIAKRERTIKGHMMN
jgi:uncharacterized membrane protein YdbT with pleckstrin-like domain